MNTLFWRHVTTHNGKTKSRATVRLDDAPEWIIHELNNGCKMVTLVRHDGDRINWTKEVHE